MTTPITPIQRPTLSLDIGFNRNYLPKRGNRRSRWFGRAYPQLRFGFTIPDEEGNPVALASRWHRGYRMLITLYDLTAETANPPEVEHLSLKLGFQKALKQSALSPTAYAGETDAPPNGIFSCFDIHPTVSVRGYSTVFEGEYPSWNVHPPDKSSRAYPGNQLIQPGEPPKRSLDVINAGSFYYTAALKVGVVADKVKTFRVDPEMVVDNNGGSPPEES